MLWLFGQIWVWLLVAFALGAALTALVLRPRPRRAELGRRPPPPESPERTRWIPAAAPTRDDEAPDHGHREGVLPGRREWHARNEWPDERDTREP